MDNNSKDGTGDMVRAKFPKVKLIENPQNLGFSKANNQALKKAQGKYALILNPDTILEKDTLPVTKKFFDEHRDAGFVTCRVELKDGSLDRDCRRRFPTPWRAFTHFSQLSKLSPKLFGEYYMDDVDPTQPHEIDACVGAFMFTTSEIIKKIGYFDEDYFFYGEDLDLCYKARKAGFKIYYTPETKIIHYKGASSGIKKHSEHLVKSDKSTKIRALRESTRAMELFYNKNYRNIYPRIITLLVILAIKIVTQARILKASL